MKKSYLAVAVSLLVIINLSALTTIGYHRYCRYRETCLLREQSGSCGYLCQKLGLNENQISEMEKARRRFLSAAESENRELTRSRRLLVNELSRDLPDTLKIDELCLRIASVQTRLQKQVVRNILTEKMILDPVQRSRYLEIIRARMLNGNNIVAPASSGIADMECDTGCQQFN